MRILLLLLAFTLRLAAQDYIGAAQLGAAQLGMVVSGGAPAGPFTPTNVPAMQFYWDYRDLATNGAAISTWVDRIAGMTMAAGGGQSAPSNTPTGLIFNSGNGLTQPATQFITNYSVWIGFSINVTNASYGALYSAGTSSGFFTFADNFDFYQSGDNNLFKMQTNVFYSFVYAGGGNSTNNVAVATKLAPAASMAFNTVGRDSSSEQFLGRIKFIGVWPYTISAASVSNLSVYASSN